MSDLEVAVSNLDAMRVAYEEALAAAKEQPDATSAGADAYLYAATCNLISARCMFLAACESV